MGAEHAENRRVKPNSRLTDNIEAKILISNHFATVTSASVRKVPCVPPLATGSSTHSSQR